jgi:hypothetical protein
MNTERKEREPTATVPEASGREVKRYQRPSLTEYGTLADITRSGSENTSDAGIGGTGATA